MHHILVTKDRATEVKAAENHSKFCDEPVDENLVRLLKYIYLSSFLYIF